MNETLTIVRCECWTDKYLNVISLVIVQHKRMDGNISYSVVQTQGIEQAKIKNLDAVGAESVFTAIYEANQGNEALYR